MIFVSVDVESDGPCPPLFSMLSFGAVEVGTDNTFYAELRPISEQYNEQALAVGGFTREQTLGFEDPATVMVRFNEWVQEIKSRDNVQLLTDNPYFDSAYLNYYFHKYIGQNPFGWSSFSLTSMYKGFERNHRASFKRLRKTQHSHNSLADARGNAEAFLAIIEKGYKV